MHVVAIELECRSRTSINDTHDRYSHTHTHARSTTCLHYLTKFNSRSPPGHAWDLHQLATGLRILHAMLETSCREINSRLLFAAAAAAAAVFVCLHLGLVTILLSGTRQANNPGRAKLTEFLKKIRC
eukprot:SAG31_NODE_2682_length_5257_cov_9.066693_7_plen_127_part_00